MDGPEGQLADGGGEQRWSMRRRVVFVLLIVVGVIAATFVLWFVIIMISAAISIVNGSARGQAKAAVQDLQVLDQSLTLYVRSTNARPTNLAALAPAYVTKIPNDPWGRAYRYSPTATGWVLSSDGADGVQGTADDVVVRRWGADK